MLMSHVQLSNKKFHGRQKEAEIIVIALCGQKNRKIWREKSEERRDATLLHCQNGLIKISIAGS
jgi:hypothetical protein